MRSIYKRVGRSVTQSSQSLGSALAAFSFLLILPAETEAASASSVPAGDEALQSSAASLSGARVATSASDIFGAKGKMQNLDSTKGAIGCQVCMST